MKKLSMLMVLAMVLLVSACGSKSVPNPNNWKTEDFSFIDQNGEDFSKSDLKGKVWIADFIFTNCSTVCLPMTANLTKLQQQLKDEGINDVEFVSFSVDPETDKPEILKNYGTKMNADLSTWHFLTGYSQAKIEKFAEKNFKTIVKKPENEDQVIHGTTFYLVDQEGTIIQDYSGVKDVPYEEIMKHIKILQNY